MTIEELREQMNEAESCGGGINSPTCGSKGWAFGTDDVESVLHGVYESSEGYEEGDTVAVVKLKDGRFGTFFEWSDASGHG